jgi:hypothetical protein
LNNQWNAYQMSNYWGGRGGATLIQTKQKREAREQRNKDKPQKQEQPLPIRHAGRPADSSLVNC